MKNINLKKNFNSHKQNKPILGEEQHKWCHSHWERGSAANGACTTQNRSEDLESGTSAKSTPGMQRQAMSKIR